MPKEHDYFVYILASLSGTLYIGVTNDLHHRVWQHKNQRCEGFTSRYGVDRLVYWEIFQFVQQAIAREKQLKGWSRAKKLALITKRNSEWKDLAADWYRTEMRLVQPQSVRRGITGRSVQGDEGAEGVGILRLRRCATPLRMTRSRVILWEAALSLL